MPPVERISEVSVAPQSTTDFSLFNDAYNFSLSTESTNRNSTKRPNALPESLDFTPLSPYEQVKDEVKILKRTDGKEIITTTSDNGTLVAFEMKGEFKLTRDEDGKSWTYVDKFGKDFKPMTISNVKVLPDGTFALEGNLRDNPSEKCTLTASSDGTFKLSKDSDGKKVEIVESKTSVVKTDANGSFERRNDGTVVIKPIGGGALVADIKNDTLLVTYPDGRKVTSEMSRDEKIKYAGATSAKVIFNGNTFDITVNQK
ncbi:MAG: hypothetical protein IAF58_10865 [Leptolyngbya sp.]|nr:hypothetical protein [Candidatus Melainabacteria bacterium]